VDTICVDRTGWCAGEVHSIWSGVKSHGRGIVRAKEEMRIPILKMERKPPKANLFDDLGVSEDMAMFAK
jgi:hypothetical protein